jgi:hypothetical protein
MVNRVLRIALVSGEFVCGGFISSQGSLFERLRSLGERVAAIFRPANLLARKARFCATMTATGF